MSFQVKLNSVDISARIVSGPVVHKNDVLHGKISPNECSFDIDNTNLAYTIANLDIEGQLVEVWIDSVKQFTGYAEKPTLTRNGRTVHVQAFDKMKQLQKLKCQDKMFIGSTADAILTWLVETCGGISSASYNLDSILVATSGGTTQAVVGYALYSIKDKLTDRLQEIVDSCGGSMWFDESGVLQFRAGFAATWSTSTVGTITVSKLKDIDSLQWLPSEGDRVIVKSKNRSVKTEKEPIFTWSGTVPPEGLPTGKDENGNAITDDQWRVKFDSPAIDIDDYATVDAAKEFDSGLTLNQTVYDANFDTGVLKYPDFMYLQIDNSSGVDKNVTKLVIEGKPVVENYLEVIYDAGSFNTEREVSNDLISSKVWASSLAKWLYENGNGKFEAVVPLADFSLGLGWKVGNKVEIVDASTGLSHRAWVRAIDIDYRNRDLTVTLRSDRDSEFEYTPPPGSITGPGTNIPYEPQFGDGSAPATPTGLSLSSFYKNGKSYVKADWNDNSEEDLLGYELRWNYDNGATWYNAGFTSQSELVIEVTGNGDTTYTVYVQVRARDNEKLQSGWSSSASITVQKDTSAPSAPGSISVVSGVGIIYVYWDRVSAIDLNYYQLERCVQTSNGGSFSEYVTIATLKSTDYIDENLEYHIQNDPEDEEYPNQWRKYKYRVKAVDLSGNGSSYRESSDTYASQATGADIAVNSVKANHIEAAFKIKAGKFIQAGTDNDHYRMTNEGFFRKKFSEAMIETMVLTCTVTGITSCDDCSKFYLQYQYSEDGGTTWNGSWLAPSFYFGIENGCFWSGFPTYVYKANGDTQTLYMPLYGYNLAGVSLNDFRIKFKLYTESGSRYIKVSEFGCIINGERLTLNSLSDFESYEDASSVNVFAYELNDVPYIKAFSVSSPWTYIMNAGLSLEEEDLDIDLAIPSILKTGTVFFDGTQESIVVAHGIPIDKSAYEILLFPEYYQYLDYGFDYSNKNYRMVMTARKPEGTEKYFNLDFYAIELTIAGETQHRDTEWLTSSLSTVFVGDGMKRVSFDVYHWGLFNFHQGSYYHEYASAGDYEVKIKQSSGEIYVDWGEGSGEEYLCNVFGSARLRNIVEKREVTETVKKLSGNIRWLMIQTQPWG